MSRIARPNQVPRASFNLRDTGPLTTTEARARCQHKAYRAAFGADSTEPNITVDLNPCPHCGSDVQWAFTTKYDPLTNKKGKYVFARCAAHPDAHRWGFRATNPEKSTVTPPPAVETQPKPAVEPETMPETTPTTPAASSNPFEVYINGIIGTRLDAHEARILQLAKEIGERTPLTVTLKIEVGDITLLVEGLRHPCVDEMVERYALGQRAFLLVGPAGTGKTTIARQFAKAVQSVRTTLIPCSEDMRRETFVGYRNAVTNEYIPSALVIDLRTEGVTVTILEELDAASSNALLCINALENGILPTPDCAETPCHARGGHHVLVCTANTWGTAGSNLYVGRNQLDAATLDRYQNIMVDYHAPLEKALVNDPETYAALVELRKKTIAAGLRKVVSTRMGMRAAISRKLKANADKTAARVLVCSELTAWSDNELNRVNLSR